MFVSRSVLLASLCFVVLLGAVGAYNYGLHGEVSSLKSQVDTLQEDIASLEDEKNLLQDQVSNLQEERDALQNNVSALESQVEELQNEIDHLQNELSHLNSTKTFVFEFLPWEQNVVNGTLRMELTFACNDSFTIIAKINDDEYNGGDYLGLIFSFNGTLHVFGGRMLFANNYTLAGAWLSNGFLVDPKLGIPTPSTDHTCVFQPDIGYTFNFTLRCTANRLKELWMTDLIYICFYDANIDGGVHICFHFGIL